jgi:hypothetical protein
MNHPKYGEITVRSITGWQTKPHCEAKSEYGMRCVRDAGHEAHDFPMPFLSPEEALRCIKAAVAEGNVKLATDMEPERGGFAIQWEGAKYGFGELTFWVDKDGKFVIDDEASSREFIAAVLMALLEKSVLVSEKRERH